MSMQGSWQEAALKRKMKRAENREKGTATLRAAGVSFETLDNGWHLRIRHGSQVIDYTPGSNTWGIQHECIGRPKLRYGVRALLAHLAEITSNQSAKET